MTQMNTEARQMQDSFTQMGLQMAGIDTAQPGQQAALQGDAGRLDATTALAGSSTSQLETSKSGAESLQQDNEAALTDAQQASTAATAQGQQLGDAATQRQEQAKSLAEQMQAWATGHAAARQQAIEATKKRLAGEGKKVLEGAA